MMPGANSLLERVWALLYQTESPATRSQQHHGRVFLVRAVWSRVPLGFSSADRRFVRMWRSFVPFPAYQVFQRGGYFSVEVIPNSVAAISLNTMYFYDSNTGAVSPHLYVKHCILTNRHGN